MVTRNPGKNLVFTAIISGLALSYPKFGFINCWWSCIPTRSRKLWMKYCALRFHSRNTNKDLIPYGIEPHTISEWVSAFSHSSSIIGPMGLAWSINKIETCHNCNLYPCVFGLIARWYTVDKTASQDQFVKSFSWKKRILLNVLAVISLALYKMWQNL